MITNNNHTETIYVDLKPILLKRITGDVIEFFEYPDKEESFYYEIPEDKTIYLHVGEIDRYHVRECKDRKNAVDKMIKEGYIVWFAN